MHCCETKKYQIAVFIFFLVISSSCFSYDFAGGTGEPNDPYQIENAIQLLQIGSDANLLDKCFILNNDIDLDPNLTGIPPFTQAPIAPDFNNSNMDFDGIPFTGIFDGNDYAIFSLVIDDNSTGNDFLGLFGRLEQGFIIKNLSVEDVNITGGNYSYYLGGLCGITSNGTISNCYSNVNITCGHHSECLGGLCGGSYESAITNCFSIASIIGDTDSERLGGLCGRNSIGIISNSFSKGSVTGGSDSKYIGGLCGSNGGSITNCFSTGSVNGDDYLGGLCGKNVGIGGDISNCFSTGPVTGGDSSEYLGGLCGQNFYGFIYNSYFLDTAGPDNGLGIPLTDTQMKQQASFTGWDFVNENTNGTSSFWIIEPNSYPQLYFFNNSFTPYEFHGGGTDSNPYRIYDANDLGAIWQKSHSHYRLVNDINLSDINWSAAVIPSFFGDFNGGNHNISNLDILGGSFLGLFGRLTKNACVLNLSIQDVNITGGDYSGCLSGLCGWNGGTISDCFSTGSVKGLYFSGCLGGLCGSNNQGNIIDCFSNCSVTGGNGSRSLGGLSGDNYYGTIIDSYSSGSVIGGGDSFSLGGLCSSNSGIINNCYATGSVNGKSDLGGLCGYNFDVISNCYAIGSVNGSIHVGGLCGENSEFGTINNCYFLVTAGPDNGFGTPLTDTQMKQQSSFVNWDFIDIWTICEWTNYPRQKWQILLPVDFLCPDGVDFIDYSFFSNHWMMTDCNDVNDCNSTDLDFSGSVDTNDLDIFTTYWLFGK